MTTARENLIAALEGEIPEVIPFSFLGDFLTTDPAWDRLMDQGLCPVLWTASTRQVMPADIERVLEPVRWKGYAGERLSLRTPVGTISQVSIYGEKPEYLIDTPSQPLWAWSSSMWPWNLMRDEGWVQEYFLKTPADYRVMEYVIRHTIIEPAPEIFLKAELNVGDRGVSIILASRSPMQSILVDFAGLERFTYHLADGFPELFALADALMDQLLHTCELIAMGPGRYVELLENLTAESWGPKRFAQYHLPVYQRVFSILHAGGKKILAHFDGKLACLSSLISKTDLDGIESLTQPPEGDMSYAEARAAWPGKFFWGNIPVSLYNLPPDELKRMVGEMAQQAAPDGRLLAFEISEDLPYNWRESIPVVLDTLADLK